MGATKDVQVSKEEIDAAVAGQTVASQFARTVGEMGDKVALRWKDGEAWKEWTWDDYANQATRVAAGLQGIGLQQGERLVMLMRNRPEFHVVDTAALLIGATPISIYNSSSPDQIEYLAGHCEAVVAVVEDIGFLERLLKVRGELPKLRTIVLLEDPDALAPDDVVSYATLTASEPVDLAKAATIAKPDDLATVIYTSGTTGPPKGVMISHYNVVWTAESYRRCLDDVPKGLRCVSYLPMAHIAERMTSHYLGILQGFEVTTCPDPSLLSQYLGAVRPESAFGVPRVWEKIYAAVNGAVAADPEKQQKFNEAIDAALPLVRKKTMEGSLSKDEQEMLDFLDAAAFKGVRELVGLDQAMFAITGAAPIPVEILEWFRAIGVPLSEIYGMSENTGPMTWEPYRVKPGTVGRAMPGVTVELLEDGEVVCKGGNVFQGYLNDPEKTAEALEGGVLHTGDIGVLDDEGYLKIVDRKKELIITAGGKNISPANLEAALKSFPLIGQCAAIGDNKPFMSALIVLDPEVAPAWAKQHGIETTSLAELAQHPDVIAEVDRNVKEANARFSQVEQIKKFTLLPAEWLPDSEELTPTSKLKRRGVAEKYAGEIEAMYQR